MVLPHDTSGCSCIFVALPPPSDDVPGMWCVSTPVMRAAVSLLYVSAVGHRFACVSLAAFTRCLQLLCCCCLPSACLHVHGIAVCRVVTCASVAVSLACCVG